MDQLSYTFDILKSAFSFLFDFWWIYLPVLLFVGVMETWHSYMRTRYIAGLKWILLEITPPPDVQRSPKIAENFFASLHAIYTKAVSGKKQFFEGKVQDWFSFEIVGRGGNMKFYIRAPEGLRNLVESQIFAQYPDAEVNIAEDYITELPEHLPTEEYDMFGTELIFTKDNAYPIKTYVEFEQEKGKDEFQRSDPLAPIAELISALLPGEHIWLQLLVRPTGGDWAKEGQAVVDKILGKTPKVKRGVLGEAFDFVDSFLPGVAASAPAEKPKEENLVTKLTPGQKDVLEKVEAKISKLGFKTGYRFLYIARKDVFNRSRISTVTGMFKQLYANNLNSFKPNSEVTTTADGLFAWLFPSGKGLFAAQDEYDKKYAIFESYKKRKFMEKVCILNTEELATLYHLPGLSVRAPAFPRVDAKKGQPPVILPTR